MISVKRLLAATCLFAAAVSTGMADTWAPPQPRVFIAEGGRHKFKVLEPKFLGASTGVLFARQADGKDKVIWSAKLANVPHQVYVTPDGNRVVTIDTYGRLGFDHSLVVYDEKGEALADYNLEDLLTDLEIQRYVQRSVSSRSWAQQATFAFSPDGKHFVIALKWSQGLPENLKGIKEYLDSIKVEAVQALIHILESLPDRVIMVDLASGKFEGGSKSR